MKKIGLLGLALVLAFGGLGIGYAHWSDTVFIDGRVEMGSLTLAFVDEIPAIVDNEPPYYDPPEYPGKDIGWGEQFYEEYIEDVHTLKEGYKIIRLVVHDAYPCYEIHFTSIVVHNIGTIPIHLTELELWDPTGYLDFEWEVPPPAHHSEGVFWRDFNGNGLRDAADEDIINVDIVNFVCTQLDPCDSTKGEIDLHFKQPAEECHTYQFLVKIGGIQWNKYVP